MSVEPHQAKAIFLAAAEKPTPAVRAAFLDEACGGDAALRARVEALLRAHDQSGSFPGRAPLDLGPTSAPEPGRGTAEGGPGQPGDGVSAARPTAESPGTRIGPYKLLQQIGEGGMGVVYRARQAGLNRVVALKMIQAGRLASAEERQRFHNEAEAAGLTGYLILFAPHAFACQRQGPAR